MLQAGLLGCGCAAQLLSAQLAGPAAPEGPGLLHLWLLAGCLALAVRVRPLHCPLLGGILLQEPLPVGLPQQKQGLRLAGLLAGCLAQAAQVSWLHRLLPVECLLQEPLWAWLPPQEHGLSLAGLLAVSLELKLDLRELTAQATPLHCPLPSNCPLQGRPQAWLLQDWLPLQERDSRLVLLELLLQLELGPLALLAEQPVTAPGESHPACSLHASTAFWRRVETCMAEIQDGAAANSAETLLVSGASHT